MNKRYDNTNTTTTTTNTNTNTNTTNNTNTNANTIPIQKHSYIRTNNNINTIGMAICLKTISKNNSKKGKEISSKEEEARLRPAFR